MIRFHTAIPYVLLVTLLVGAALVVRSIPVRGQSDEGIVRTNTDGTTTSDSSLASAQLDAEIVREIELINSITIDDTLFSNPTFKALSDFGRPLPTHPVGRRDPFRASSVEFGFAATATSTP